MKEINSQLTDAMIVSLADAQESGVDFSVATELADIPESMIVEAKEYWDLLIAQKDFAASIYPRPEILDAVFAKLDSAVAERQPLIVTPSPYMKYVMAFAAPLAVLVLMIGVAFRTQPEQSTDMAEGGAQPLAANEADAVPAAAPMMLKAAPATSSLTPSAKRAMMPRMAAAEVPKDDPRQLLAMLSDAGTQEAVSETDIDDEYDARLSELDAKVMSTDNSNSYAPL